ncbi:probable G-protein coupled receptor 88 [Pangasianodon hypophthalmus]|uniref:probable G-protein coupled receptor 88 n=1 Tax=Pangasianodon hypophthalmus TaxID=310915 RepID=UPI000EFEAAFF|nr:probable G-protein coupled receptor 88 [Pangasianodon hypophthalmus]XP_053093937.1 probable G-protein coupled receptor 88 [Pangasianodon hypophthalmus]
MQNSTAVRCDTGAAERISIAALFSFMCALGTVLNLLVIGLVLSFKKLRTASNAFIVNGCAADLLVCALWMPREAAVAASVPSPLYGAAPRDALLFLGATVSLLSHSLIAVNRYVLITKPPAAYHALYQRRRAQAMIAASWLVAFACLLPPWLAVARHPAFACGLMLLMLLSEPWAAATLALTILGQTAVVTYCYFKIFRRVQISAKRVSVLHFQLVNHLPYSFPRKDKRLGVHVLTVCLVFVLTTEPVLWTLTAGLFAPVPAAFRTCAWLLFCSVFVSDPFLYTWKNEEFRKAFRSVLRRDFWRGSTVAAEPVTVSTVSHVFPRQNSRRAFLAELS